jgi:hypothetical protein
MTAGTAAFKVLLGTTRRNLMTMQGQKDRTKAAVPARSWNWPRLLRTAVVGELVVAAFYVAIGAADVGIPAAILLVPALLWLRRRSRGSAIYAGVACSFIGLVVLVAFGNLFELAYPTSWETFVSAATLLVLTMAAVVAMVGSIRRGTSDVPAAGRLARIATGAILASVVFGVGAGLTVKNDTRQPGDLLLTITRSVESSPRALTTDAGEVTIFVQNQSTHRNTLTIDGVVSRDVPAKSRKRVVFTVPPGTYHYYSEAAPDDTAGTLIVR